MRYSYAGIGMLLMGIVSFAIIMVFQAITINNEADYYSLKEAMEASMIESIDIPYYRNYASGGDIKIVEEKFIENFTRRFVKNTMGNSNGYILEFYDIMESPPKASIKIKNKTGSMILTEDGGNFDVVNALSGILVYKAEESSNCEHETVTSYYYSYVERVGKESNCNVTNKTVHNLGGVGQILRAYSSELDANYTYSYELINSDYYFYNVCYNSINKKYKDNIHNFYTNFVSGDICGYPFYKNAGGYAYSNCVDKMLNWEEFGSNFTVSQENIDKINFSTHYLDYDYASDINVTDFTIRKATDSEISTASDGDLNTSDNLYFISWTGSCEKQTDSSGACSGYDRDNVLMVMEITWNVTKCKK